jgi:hypothetical protein
LRAKDLDHADDGAQQAQQRRRRGDGGQRIAQVFFEPVGHGAAGAFHGGAQVGLGALGVVVEARSPLASTSPSAEFVPAGSPRRAWARPCAETVMASSSSLGAATRAVFRADEALENQARARTEQAIRGQMGQPAACMMDSNSLSAQVKATRTIMAQRIGRPGHKSYEKVHAAFFSPTKSVDNFVGNWAGYRLAKCAKPWLVNRLMKN